MRKRKVFLITGVLIAVFLIKINLLKAADDVSEYFGCWALTLPGNVPGWIEIRNDKGYLDADILWGGGSVLPVASVYLEKGKLVVTRVRELVRERDEEKKPIRSHTITSRIFFTVKGDNLNGIMYTPSYSGTEIREATIEGIRIPPPPEAPDLSKVNYGDPKELFNGKDLTGWELINPKSTNGFSVENGILINNPVQKEGEPHVWYGNIRTIEEFEDFNIKLEVNVPENGNSGVYLRGIYEVQVFDSYGKPLDSHNMGGLYSRITPSENAERPAGEWQTYNITLCQRHLTVILNDVTIIDNQPIKGITGGALTSNEFAPGPIYLQGDHDKVMYRNIILTPIVK